MSTEAESRFRDFDLQGFHQVIAISEDNINASLNDRFDEEIQPELLSFSHEVPGFGVASATLNPPRVSICTETESETTMSIFYLNFKSGSYQYKTQVEGGTTETVNLDGATVAFDVRFDEKRLQAPPPGNPALESKWKKLEPGKYSLNQIVMFLGSAPLSSLNLKETKLPGLDPNSPRFPMKKLFFDMFITMYLTKLQAHPDALTLGYAIKKESAEKDERNPTYPPTSVKYQNYRYQPCKDTSAIIDGKPVAPGARNAFLFVEMTNNDAFPQEKLERKGNIIVGNMPGGLVLGKQLFVQKYLVGTAFKDFNTNMLDTANQLFTWIHNESGYPGAKQWWLTDGSRDEAVSKAKWSLAGDGKSASASWEGRMHNSYRDHSPFGETLTTNYNAGIYPKPRTNEIMVDAQLNLFYHEIIPVPSLSGQPSGVDRFVEAEVYFKLVFRLVEVHDDGLLGVEVEQTIKTCRCRAADNRNRVAWAEWVLGPSNDNLANELTEKLRGVITPVGDVLATYINKQQQFVFPGSKTFFYKNPMFSDACDLLVRLEYQQKDLNKK